MYESKDKLVSHPAHYQTKMGLEVHTIVEALTENLVGIEAVDTAHIIRYIARWKKKGETKEDWLRNLEKAQWYLAHLIEHVREEITNENR